VKSSAILPFFSQLLTLSVSSAIYELFSFTIVELFSFTIVRAWVV